MRSWQTVCLGLPADWSTFALDFEKKIDILAVFRQLFAAEWVVITALNNFLTTGLCSVLVLKINHISSVPVYWK